MDEKIRKELILNHCPNYDDISNYVYMENDDLSKILIGHYQDFVFEVDIDNEEELALLLKVNNVFEKYIDDYSFARSLRRHLSIRISNLSSVIIRELMHEIIEYTSKYEEDSIKNISNTRWL